MLLVEQMWLAASEQLTRCRPDLGLMPEFAFQVEMLLVACYAELEQPDKRLEAAKAAVQIDPISLAATARSPRRDWRPGTRPRRWTISCNWPAGRSSAGSPRYGSRIG